jgi:uncharacterized protein YdaU (DUF1376 family)
LISAVAMSNRDLPMMPWFPKEFAAATSTWSFAERSAYRALLDVEWEEGALPDEPERLARAIGMELAEFKKVWPKVRRKFVKADGELFNERLEEHRLTSKRKKQGHAKGAEITNAKRAAQRGGKRIAKRIAQRDAKRVASASPPSPSPSPSEESEHPLPPQGGGNGLKANGGRARSRDERDRSLAAWREIAAEADRIAATGSLPSDQRLTWIDIQTTDELARKAGEIVGFRKIADRDKFNASELQSRFREAYEREQQRAQHQ